MNLKCTWNTGKELLDNSPVAGRCGVMWCSRVGATQLKQCHVCKAGEWRCFWCWIMLKPAWLINPRVKHTWWRGEPVADLVKYQIKQQTSGTRTYPKMLSWHSWPGNTGPPPTYLLSGEGLPTIPFLELVWRFLPWVGTCLKVTPWRKRLAQSLVRVSKINI